MRIFYLCPDCDFPSGGIKRLYTHVELLCDNGYDAYIMHYNKGFKPKWFESQVPVVYNSDPDRKLKVGYISKEHIELGV